MSIFNLIFLLFCLGIVNFIISLSALRRFLSQYKAISTYLVLEQFKDVVRKQMYQALLQIVFLGGMGILGVIGFITGKLSTSEFVMFFIFNGINLLAGKYGKETERRIKTLSIENPGVKEEYKSICRTWDRKPFPNF